MTNPEVRPSFPLTKVPTQQIHPFPMAIPSHTHGQGERKRERAEGERGSYEKRERANEADRPFFSFYPNRCFPRPSPPALPAIGLPLLPLHNHRETSDDSGNGGGNGGCGSSSGDEDVASRNGHGGGGGDGDGDRGERRERAVTDSRCID